MYGHTITYRTRESAEKVRDLVDSNTWLTVRMMAEELNLGQETDARVLKESLYAGEVSVKTARYFEWWIETAVLAFVLMFQRELDKTMLYEKKKSNQEGTKEQKIGVFCGDITIPNLPISTFSKLSFIWSGHVYSIRTGIQKLCWA